MLAENFVFRGLTLYRRHAQKSYQIRQENAAPAADEIAIHPGMIIHLVTGFVYH